MTAYLDASVLIPTVVSEPATAAVDAFMDSCRTSLIISEFAAAEVASALSRLVRTGRLQSRNAQDCLSDFDAWRSASTQGIDVLSADVSLAHVYVRRFDLMLRTPDALHAAICRRADLTLVTLDKRLAAAARALGVKTLLPGSDELSLQ